MDPLLIRAFWDQIFQQLKYLELAAQDAQYALDIMQTTPTLRRPQDSIDPHTRLFLSLQTMLMCAANVSKALWGSGSSTKTANSRAPLRESLGITEKSPVWNTAMRNNFEHYDDRLDRWWKESERHNFIAWTIAPLNFIEGADDIDRFVQFDQTNGDIAFWGDRFNLPELLKEARSLIMTVSRLKQDFPWGPEKSSVTD